MKTDRQTILDVYRKGAAGNPTGPERHALLVLHDLEHSKGDAATIDMALANLQELIVKAQQLQRQLRAAKGKANR